MSVPKTKPTGVSVESHIAAIANEEQRNDAQSLVVLMRKVTRQEPRMWGPSIVGFGSYHYRYASGHEGDAALMGFSPRKTEFSIYLMYFPEHGAAHKALLAKLGKHRMGKACLYVKSLEDIDVRVLEKLVRMSVAALKRRYPPQRTSGTNRKH